MLKGFFGMISDYPETKLSQYMVLSFFGHHIDDEDVLKLLKDTKNSKPKKSKLKSLKMGLGFMYLILFGPKYLIKSKKEIIDERKYSIVKRLKECSSAKEIFDAMLDEVEKNNKSMVGFKYHGPVSFGSTIKNMILRNILEGAMSGSYYNIK